MNTIIFFFYSNLIIFSGSPALSNSNFSCYEHPKLKKKINHLPERELNNKIKVEIHKTYSMLKRKFRNHTMKLRIKYGNQRNLT